MSPNHFRGNVKTFIVNGVNYQELIESDENCYKILTEESHGTFKIDECFNCHLDGDYTSSQKIYRLGELLKETYADSWNNGDAIGYVKVISQGRVVVSFRNNHGEIDERFPIEVNVGNIKTIWNGRRPTSYFLDGFGRTEVSEKVLLRPIKLF